MANPNPYSPSGNPYVAPVPTPGTPDDVLDGPSDPEPKVLDMPMTTRPRQMPNAGPETPEEVEAPEAPDNTADAGITARRSPVNVPIICHADGQRFSVEASQVSPRLRCVVCGSGEHLDLDEGMEVTADRTDPTIDSAEGYEYTPAPEWVQRACRRRFEGGGVTAIDPKRPGHYLHGVGNFWDGPSTVIDNGDGTLSYENPYNGDIDRFDETGYFTRAGEHKTWGSQYEATKTSSFETDPEMGEVKEVEKVKQHVTCSTCLNDATVEASDPAQPMPPCPNCGAETLSPAGSTLAARRRAKIAEITRGVRATNPGMPPRMAHKIARQTVQRYPKIIGN